MRSANANSVAVNVDAMGRTMRTFGEADPINYLKMLGGVTSPSDYSSGLTVQGSTPSQSIFTVGKATIFFPYHFGGIFSLFNVSHFPWVELSKGNYDASSASRLGAAIKLKSRNFSPDRTRINANLGMTASSADIRTPLSDRFSVEVSGRLSYIDRLYGPLLDMGDQKINYSFGETAVSAIWNPTDDNKLKFDFIYGADDLNVNDRHYSLDTKLNWRNMAISLLWTGDGDTPYSVWATRSWFRNILNAQMPALTVDVPSSIDETKVGGEINVSPINDSNLITAGIETAIYHAQPQHVNRNVAANDAAETRIYATWKHMLNNNLSFDIGGRISFYCSKTYNSWFVSPVVNLNYSDEINKAGVHFTITPQYIHQTGLADIGLSSDFWFPASDKSPRELASAFSLSYSRSLFEGRLDIGIEPYFKRILHEPEYNGILLDLIEKDYNLDDHLIRSNGFNTGFDLSASINAGPLSGIANYSLGFARRHFPTDPGRYLPAMSENLHSFGTTLSYNLTDKWTFGANFTLSSGRCYTPVKALYMLAENVMMVLGPRNSKRMPTYHRLDISGSYRFKTTGRIPLTHMIVFSLINAYGHRNVELSTYRFSYDDGTFYRHNVSSLYRFLPSLSYSIEF